MIEAVLQPSLHGLAYANEGARSNTHFSVCPSASACFEDDQDYTFPMATIGEVEKLALSLSEKQRAILAAQLLGSLPPVLQDDDEGMAEAGRRDAELEADPSLAISLTELDEQVRRRRS